MKTNVLHLCTFTAAAAAFAIAPLSPLAACVAVTVAGVATVVLLDYGRARAPIGARAEVIAFAAPAAAPEVAREAA